MIEVPEETLNKWQSLVNTMCKIVQAPTGLIMKLEKPDLGVFVASNNPENIAKVGHKEDWASVYCGQAIKSKKPLLVPNALKTEEWADNPLAKIGFISYLGFPLFFPNGDPFGTICVLDIKENAYSEDFKDLIEQFKTMVEGQLKLISQAKELEISNKELDQYASVVSHDLKVPLNAIMGYAGLLQKNENYSQEKSKVDGILKAGDHMVTLLENLLKLSRLNAEGLDVDEVDLNLLLNKIIESLEFKISQKGGTIKVNKLPKLIANDLLMRQLFQNLISNALEYCRVGVAPEITVSSSSDSSEWVEIRVEDNGVGIDEKDFDDVFQPLKRLDQDIDVIEANWELGNDFEGTGLGLAIVKKIVDKHRGKITIQSELRKGSTFIVSLPKETLV